MIPSQARSTASRVATVLVAIIALWLVLKLLGVALKLIGVLILVGLAVAIYVGLTQHGRSNRHG